jgi:alpha-beta hydrolase superfamily lysophospholipase
MPLPYRAALWLTAHTVPWMTLTGSGLKIWPSDNIPMLRKFSRDPLVIKKTRTDAVWGLVNLMDDARRAAGDLKNPPPLLMLTGEKDQVIPRPPTEAVMHALKAHAPEKIEVHVYPKGYHMLLRDLEGPEVWQDVVTWIDAHTPR